MDYSALWLAIYTSKSAKERIEATKAIAQMQCHLRQYDVDNGTNALYNFTIEHNPFMKGLTMADIEIDDEVPPPETVAETKAAKAAKSRGRPKGVGNKPPENSQLLAAVEFVGIVENEAFENSKYLRFADNQVKSYSNVIAAGHPVAEELNVCPQTAKMKAALNRCGRSLSITETEAGHISIKGDKIRATVPCMADPIADVNGDPPIITGDFDILKAAFKACSTVGDEKEEKATYASLLLDPNTASATNGKVLIQFWHGIANLPPGTVVPIVFAKLAASQKYKITGLGGNWNADAGLLTSLTLWFENGAWLKTQCYEDRWPDINPLLNVAVNPLPVPEGLFEAVAAVEPFCTDSGAVHFSTNAVQSHKEADVGAVYKVKDLPAGKVFHAKLIKQVSPYVTTLDLFAMQDRAFFFGGSETNPVRGVFMGMSGSQ